MRRFHTSVAALVLGLLAGACRDPVDQAAKARIFSPEDPPRVVASAAERLDAQQLASQPALVRRVLRMDAAELTERLGPHLYRATLSTEWTSPRGTLKLAETRTLRAGRGGVAGDFHGTLENGRDQGLEVLRVGGQVFARSRYGTFRQRLRDRGMAEATRAELTGALRDLDTLFRGRLALEPHGAATHEGRRAWRYSVALAPPAAAPPGPAAAALPPAREPRSGRDESTLRRLAFLDKREPVALAGEVWLDAETAVVLKARLDGRLAVSGADGAQPAEVRLVLDSSLGEVGREVRLAAPEPFLPDADKPEGIADALDRFGIPRAGRPGAQPPPSVAEPEDGAEESEAPSGGGRP